MKLESIMNELCSSKYDFLKHHKNLGNNIIITCLGGSYAYGTNTDESDIDIRGVATNSKRNILIGNDFEQFVDKQTDTTIYSFEKTIKLLCSCNPNIIEMLGLNPHHYLYLSDAGLQLLHNKRMFLSKAAIHTFGGYAKDQLRRLENKASRISSQVKQEESILRSIECASDEYRERYFRCPEDAINLFIDKSFRDGYDAEIFMDINLTHYPLRDFKDMLNDMNNIVNSYGKLGSRNEKAITRNKLGKHMMHLVRLYYMCFDILERQEIITYREKEHDLLMSIRNGDLLDAGGNPTGEFYDMLNDLDKRFLYARMNTELPDRVDANKVYDFVMSINERICNG